MSNHNNLITPSSVVVVVVAVAAGEAPEVSAGKWPQVAVLPLSIQKVAYTAKQNQSKKIAH